MATVIPFEERAVAHLRQRLGAVEEANQDLIAFARGDSEERDFWRRTLEDCDQHPGDLERAMRLVERRGAVAETLRRARAYAEEAAAALTGFPDGTLRRALIEATEFATARGF